MCLWLPSPVNAKKQIVFSVDIGKKILSREDFRSCLINKEEICVTRLLKIVLWTCRQITQKYFDNLNVCMLNLQPV